jgi:hypothetical protein
LLLANVAAAGTRDPETPDSKYVSYGEKFECIGKLCGKYKNGTNYCASAVAIKPRWIVTAAHVVQNSEICFVTIKDKKILVKKINYPKEFEEGKFGHYDIAIGNCDEDMGLDFYPVLYENKDEVGKICSMSGYGITGTFHTGTKISDNKKRAGSNYIEHIDRDLLVCSASRRREKSFTELEFIIGSGDSGGGLFIDGKLAGINSCVLASDKSPDSTYGDESGHTRISKYLDWINENIKD